MQNSLRIIPLAVSLLPAVSCFPLSAHASSPSKIFIVDQTSDSEDGSCSEGTVGLCNLRAALKEASKNERSIIRLKVDSLMELGSVAIDSRERHSIATKIESMDGRQARIMGIGLSRLFEIGEKALVSLSDIHVSGFAAIDGGAIKNEGELVLHNVTFRENKAFCSASGAMTAFAACGGGAIVNSGRIRLEEGNRFERNEVHAAAYAASYTSAQARGGAISSGGAIIFAGLTVFDGNRTFAEAHSGFHPMPHGGAAAASVGGALSISGGSLKFEKNSVGRCAFSNNSADSNATSPEGNAETSSQGGAAYLKDVAFPSLLSSCVYADNSARDDSDVAFVPSEAKSTRIF